MRFLNAISYEIFDNAIISISSRYSGLFFYLITALYTYKYFSVSVERFSLRFSALFFPSPSSLKHH